MTDYTDLLDERALWVENDKQLYTMWNLTSDTLEEFVRKNGPVIDQIIQKTLEKADEASRKVANDKHRSHAQRNK